MYRSRIFGFKHQYPQEFLDQLAKDMGFDWTPVKFKTVNAKDIEVRPLGPPSRILAYIDIKYKEDKK